jgi:hypothetical protein
MLWFLGGCALVGLVQTVYVSQRSGDPTILLQIGEEAVARPRLERELGPVALVPKQGHDGKYFYLIAREPRFWRADGELLEGLQDPAYRYGRPLYPLVAGLGGTLSPMGTLAGLIVLQVLSGGLFTAAVVALARWNGLPILAVVIGLATPCLYSATIFLTSDLLALALSLTGLVLWQRGRIGTSAALLSLAVLAKEYYVLTPLALAVTTLRSQPKSALVVSVVPLIPILAWKWLLVVRFGIEEGVGNLGWPGAGLLEAAGSWSHPMLGGLAVLLVVVSLAAVVRRSRPLPRWQCVAWGTLGLCASYSVWANPAELLRVISPAWWFAVWYWYPTRWGPGVADTES